MGFFLRPKDTNKDAVNDSKTSIKAEAIGVVAAYENEYIGVDSFDTSTDGLSGARHNKDPIRREASPNDPLPTGGRSAGTNSPGVRGWRTPIARRGSMPKKGR